MATIALAAAGAAVGSAFLPAGVTILGTTLTGAAIGSQIGAMAGSYVDQALFAPSGQSRTFHGPRLSNLYVTSSTEGAPIPRVYGRFRLGGQVIWASDIEEEIVTSTQSQGGGKGTRRTSSKSQVTQIEYRYSASFAVALCEGPISGIGRVWADGQEIDLAGLVYRLYRGDGEQTADSLIVAREGAENAPAYRGVAYIVFERLPLADYGNRLPQLSFEVHRAVDRLHEQISAVVLIPGSGEFAYAGTPVTRLGSGGKRVYENVHTRQGATDWQVGIDQLEAALPNAKSVSLVVSWFGTDLRASHCQIKPGVELPDKQNAPVNWSVAGLERAQAHLVSQREGRPAYGGTPTDASVVAAIRDLKKRGLDVTLTPFILMDISETNALPDPYSDAMSQPAYPWRGRITLSIAPGRPGSPDKSTGAVPEIAAVVGTAVPADFAISGEAVSYSGPDEWTLRRQVLHYASLAKAAGGVDSFVIGTELRGLTQVRSSASGYPFVSALVALAGDVKAILGPGTKVTYAADWSEYFGHQPQDGSGDVYFHLDPLWASPAIDAIGIDLYWPLADWREGTTHADAVAGVRSVYDVGYLKSNIAGGEGFDWFYSSEQDRRDQIRTPITDGAGKPWVYRYKDLRSWWSEQHFDRPGGTEANTPTAWLPQMKPVWFMECGCPAVDKGANQPNVFVDPKSVESALPHFSSGRRDDLMQRRYIEALVEAFDPRHPARVPGLNPVSAVYGAAMVDPARIYVYAWDTRPFPAFPVDTDTWSDGANWRLGHWLNGRLASAPLSDLVGAILDDHGFDRHDASRLEGVVVGYAVDRIMSAREAIQPLELAFFFDAVESGGKISFSHRGAGAPSAEFVEDDLVEGRRDASPLSLVRGQESELPVAAKVAYLGASGDYRQAIAEARRLSGTAGRVAQADLAMAMESDQAAALAETWLFEAWVSRERASFVLPPSALALEPGDTVAVTAGGLRRIYRITSIGERGAREIEALAVDPLIYRPTLATARDVKPSGYPVAGLPLLDFVDLPLLRGDESEEAGYVAASQSPWPGAVAVYSSPEAAGFRLVAVAFAPATTGMLLSPLPPGPSGRFDCGTRIEVKLDRGELSSASVPALLAGANTAAVRNAEGEWETLQFQTATLIAPQTYRLTVLLRGQAGTDDARVAGHPAGARFVVVDAALTRVDLAPAEVGLPLNWKYGPASRDLGDESFASAVHAYRGVAMRPYRPVHLRAVRSEGDIELSWIRRTRTGGDGWDGIEVPLGEESERYEVDILDGSAVVRTLVVGTPAATYTTGEQMADFGSLQTALRIRVYQANSSWGRGSPAEAVV